MAGKYGAARRREQATKAVNMLEDRTIFTCAQDGDVRRVRYAAVQSCTTLHRHHHSEC